MQSSLGQHFGEEALEGYALGKLPEELLPSFEEHILSCEPCQMRLQEVEQFMQVASIAASEIRAESHAVTRPHRKVSWLWAVPKPVWAAAFAALVAAVLFPSLPRSGGTTSELTLLTQRGLEPSVPSGTHVILKLNAADLHPTGLLTLQVVNASGAEIWRSPVTPSGSGEIRIKVAEALRSGRYWVRLSDTAGPSLLREFAIIVK